MSRPFLKKSIWTTALVIVIGCVLLAGFSSYFSGKNRMEPVVQDSGAPAITVTSHEDVTANSIGSEDSEGQIVSDTDGCSKQESIVSQADRDAVDRFKAKWDRWAPYAVINQLLGEGRWDEILRMVKAGEFGVDQPVNPAGMTLMEIALRRSYMDGVRELYDLEADLQPPGRDLVRIVCSAGNLEGLKFLHDHGVDIVGKSGIMGLRSAIQCDNLDIMDYLMELGLTPRGTEGSSYDALFLSITPKTFGKTARRLIELGYELQDEHVYEIARSANSMLVDILMENGVDLESVEIDPQQLQLQSSRLLKLLESQGLDAPQDLVLEGDSFMDAVINSSNTDVAFLQYLGEKGLYANQTQLERIRQFAEKYSEPTVVLEINDKVKIRQYYPHAAEVADYIASQLGE